MNIFYTDNDVDKCANNHCTVHVRKMIVEYAQLLSTAHHVLDGVNAREGIYRKSHVNHPSAIWVRESSENYIWLYNLYCTLLDIYELNTGRKHKTGEKRDILNRLPVNIPEGEFTVPPQCMPDEFKCEDTTEAYKAYLAYKYADWGSRERVIKVEYYT